MDWPTTKISVLVRQFAVYPQLSQTKMKCDPRGHNLASLFNYWHRDVLQAALHLSKQVVSYSIEAKTVTKLQLSESSKSQLPPLDSQRHCSIALPCPRGHKNIAHG